jgi:DUF4097 and DUF4098 domain-containing protein YvlB
MIRQERFDTPGRVEVVVNNKLGDVRLIVHAAPVTEVELRREGPHGDEIVENASVEQQNFDGNSRVMVDVPDLSRSVWQRGADVVVTVRLPEGSSVDVGTVSGKITADGALGATRARTTSGDVSLGSVNGDLVVRSTSGDVMVGSVTGGAEIATASGSVRCGPLTKTGLVKTASGDVDVDSAQGSLTVETTSGDVTAGQLHDGCDLKTVSGDQRVRQLFAGIAQFKTVSGDLTVSVARGTAVVIDAESLSGSLSSEIELSSEEPAPEGPGQQAGPRAELRARTVSGDVRVRRAPA